MVSLLTISKAFHTISMYVALGVPQLEDEKYDACLIIMEKFTKTIIIEPCHSHFTARSLAEIFFDRVINKDFLPRVIIFNRDVKLTSDFWRLLMHWLGITLAIRFTYLQQSNPVERAIQTIGTALKIQALLVSNVSNWYEELSFIELVMNETPHATTGFTPNELLYVDYLSLLDASSMFLVDDVQGSDDGSIIIKQANCYVAVAVAERRDSRRAPLVLLAWARCRLSPSTRRAQTSPP